MPTAKSNLTQVPINADTFNLTGDLGTMGESILSLVPVASDAAGDTVATTRADAGFAVTDARPLFVYNTTTKTIRVKDASGWRDLSNTSAKAYEGIVTAGSGGFTALTVVNNIPTFTFKAGRRYEIVWDGHYQSSVAADYLDLSIQTCSTTDAAGLTTGLTLLRQKTFRCSAASILEAHIVRAPVTYGTDTTLQIKFLGARGAGTGTVNLVASATNTLLYQIYDLGAVI